MFVMFKFNNLIISVILCNNVLPVFIKMHDIIFEKIVLSYTKINISSKLLNKKYKRT